MNLTPDALRRHNREKMRAWRAGQRARRLAQFARGIYRLELYWAYKIARRIAL